jgi:hypothetical protein
MKRFMLLLAIFVTYLTCYSQSSYSRLLKSYGYIETYNNGETTFTSGNYVVSINSDQDLLVVLVVLKDEHRESQTFFSDLEPVKLYRRVGTLESLVEGCVDVSSDGTVIVGAVFKIVQ